MKHIPSYLMPKIVPPSGANATQDDDKDSSNLGHISFHKNNRRQSKNHHNFASKVLQNYYLFICYYHVNICFNKTNFN